MMFLIQKTEYKQKRGRFLAHSKNLLVWAIFDHIRCAPLSFSSNELNVDNNNL